MKMIFFLKANKYNFSRVGVICTLFFISSCGQGKMENQSNSNSLKIACAANMEYAMDSIAVLFEQETAIKCNITAGSSGMLTSQIQSGAPYDLFISANMDYPQKIFKTGEGKKPVVFAKGRLVFVINSPHKYESIDATLVSNEVSKIAIADDQVAPYGIASRQFLRQTKRYDTYSEKLVTGESIGQVNYYISSNAVNAGFTNYAFKVKNGSKYHYIEVDQMFFDPIDHGLMILNYGVKHHGAQAEKFYNFLTTSEKCKSVLNYFGYLTED